MKTRSLKHGYFSGVRDWFSQMGSLPICAARGSIDLNWAWRRGGVEFEREEPEWRKEARRNAVYSNLSKEKKVKVIEKAMKKVCTREEWAQFQAEKLSGTHDSLLSIAKNPEESTARRWGALAKCYPRFKTFCPTCAFENDETEHDHIKHLERFLAGDLAERVRQIEAKREAEREKESERLRRENERYQEEIRAIQKKREERAAWLAVAKNPTEDYLKRWDALQRVYPRFQEFARSCSFETMDEAQAYLTGLEVVLAVDYAATRKVPV